jgi:putative peptide zinc metalloprotease protein
VANQASGGLPLPEKPRLADGVSLAGQMRESAFVDPPWLIDRRGEGYVQLTELLYRIGEQLDGKHTFEEIANAVSQATGRSVTADNVRQLVDTQFVRKGLVPLADGRVIGSAHGSRSLLQLNMRLRAFDGKTIDPVVRLLQWLYWPPILVLGVAAALGLEAWLYLVHGIAAGVHDALYTPGLLLVVLLATVLSAGFHELGHAAALRYGGGFPRAMGAGLYIVYPAFYTDVSDNYRLGRWARVRTDLGGFYFNLLFAIGVMALYALTGQEMLLLIVPLLNLDMLRQLVPIMRLDGYWTLADLTGVPDFISHMGAFVRSALPFGSKDTPSRLPALKPWAGFVFGGYVLLAIPLIAVQLLFMLRGVPRILATAWDSAVQEVPVISQSQASGDTRGVILACLHVFALMLPALAVGLGLSRLVRRVGRGVWRWSAHSTGRRAVAGVGSLAVMGFLVYAWFPVHTPGAGAPSSTLSGQASYAPVQPDERGSVGDLVSGQIATTTPRATSTVTVAVTLTSTPAVETPVPTSQPVSTAATPARAPAIAVSSPTAPRVATITLTPAARQTLTGAVTSPVPRTPSPTPTGTPTATSRPRG